MSVNSVLPEIGLGTFKARGPDVKSAVRCALEHGIRHIDTASVYKNEVEIGDAIRDAIENGLLRREDVYVTSKLSPYEQGAEAATLAFEASLTRLGLDYIDLMLIHWPGVAKTELSSPINATKRLETWRVLEEFHDKGLALSIGVSNYSIPHLQELLAVSRVHPAYNQVECHPLWQQESLRAFCADHDIGVIAYSPFAVGAFFTDPQLSGPVRDIATMCGKTSAQVLCCWALQKGCSGVLPKSTLPERIAEFSPQAKGMQRDSRSGRWLPEEVEAALDALVQTPKKFCWDPSSVA